MWGLIVSKPIWRSVYLKVLLLMLVCGLFWKTLEFFLVSVRRHYTREASLRMGLSPNYSSAFFFQSLALTAPLWIEYFRCMILRVLRLLTRIVSTCLGTGGSISWISLSYLYLVKAAFRRARAGYKYSFSS